MKENKNGTRFSLYTEDLIEGLNGFFEEIEENSKNYAFVAIADGRCFNLAYSYMKDKSHVCSFSGLLLQYKCIADAYKNSSPNRFPHILLVDDVLVHGRNMAKIISHLEELLFDELQPSKIEELFEMRRELVRSIDIFVYAMRRFPLLLSEKHSEKITFVEKLYDNDLRDVSLQLTDRLIRCDVANTCFVPSIRCQLLSDVMLERVGRDSAIGDWKLFRWEYFGETMIFACRFGGIGNINRISTIRFFPERGKKDLSWITSCTLLGNIKSEVFNDLCMKLADILDVDDGAPLRNILIRQETLLQYSRGQLLCYLISAVDLIEFMECMCQTNIEGLLGKIDFDKTAVYFGDSELCNALDLALENRTVRERIAKELIPFLEQEAGLILTVEPECCVYQKPISMEDERKDIHIFNEIVQEILFMVGITSEKSAYGMRDKPYLFHPETYQDYQEYQVNKLEKTSFGNEISDDDYGYDGVIPLDAFGHIAFKETLERGFDVQNYVFHLMASYVMLMDTGVLGNIVQTSRKHSDFMMLTRA